MRPKQSQNQFVVTNNIAECPNCGRTCVLRISSDPLQFLDQEPEPLVMCSRCMKQYHDAAAKMIARPEEMGW